MENKKMKKNLIYCMIAIVIITGVLSIVFPKEIYSAKTLTSPSTGIIGEIDNGDVVEQKFIADNNYEKIGIYFATMERILTKGKLLITITDENQNVKKQEVKLSKINDNSYYYFKYKFKKNKEYVISIVLENSEYPITMYCIPKEKNTELKINNKEQETMLALSFAYKEESYFNVWYSAMALALLIGYLSMSKKGEE